MVIEADFAPGDDPWVLSEPFKFEDMGVGYLGSFVRVNADCGPNPIVLFGKWDGGVQLFWPWASTDGEDGGDARGARAFEHGGAVFVELGEVDVGVGID